MRFNIKEFNCIDTGTEIIVSMKIPRMYAKMVDAFRQQFQPAKYYELKPYRQKRSLNANAYMWVLADKLADKLRTTPVAIYRTAIDNAGVFEEIKVGSVEAAQRFKRIWQSNGLGWLTKTIDDTTIFAYYGSSTYDSKQLARVIDFLQDECREQCIETRPQEEVDAMLREWDQRNKKDGR